MRKALRAIGILTAILGLAVVPAAAADTASVQPAGTDVLFTATIAPKRVPPSGLFIPPHRLNGGDFDFFGHGPDVSVGARITSPQPTRKLAVRLSMVANETEFDFTGVDGESGDFVIYEAPAGHCLGSVNRATNDGLRYIDTDHDVDVFPSRNPGTFVREWRTVGDTGGNEAGTRTGVVVFTHALEVQVQRC